MRILGVSALAAVLICAGCGGGRLSEPAFRAKANRICAQMNRRTNALGSLTTHTLNVGLQTIQTGISQLDQLQPPASETDSYADFLSSLKRTMALLRKEGPQIVKLVRALERATPRRIGERPHARYFAISRRLRQLAQSLNAAIRPAIADAPALGLHQCSFGVR